MEIDQGRYGLVVHVDPAGKPDFALHHLVDGCQWRASWPGEGDLANINVAAGHHTRECEFSAIPPITDPTPADRVRAYLDLHEGCDLHTDYIAHHMRPRQPGYLVTPADLLASDLRALLAELEQQRERADAAEERLNTQPVYVLNLDDSPLSQIKIEAIKRIIRSDDQADQTQESIYRWSGHISSDVGHTTIELAGVLGHEAVLVLEGDQSGQLSRQLCDD